MSDILDGDPAAIAYLEAAVYARVQQLIVEVSGWAPGFMSVAGLMGFVYNYVAEPGEYFHVRRILHALGYDLDEPEKVFARVLFDMQETNEHDSARPIHVYLGRPKMPITFGYAVFPTSTKAA